MNNKYVIYVLDDREFLSVDDGTTGNLYEAKTFSTIEDAREYMNELDWNSQVMYLQVKG